MVSEALWSDQRPQKPSEELATYLKGVGGSLASAIGPEERSCLVDNVFREMIGHEASLASVTRTAPVVESLVKLANKGQLALFLHNVRSYFGFLCSSRQGSFVLQQLFVRMQALLSESPSKEENRLDGEPSGDESGAEDGSKPSDEEAPSLEDLASDLCKTLVVKNVWCDMMFDPSATHVLRAFVCVLAGKDPSSHKKDRAANASASALSQDKATRDRQHSFRASLHALLVELSKWEATDIQSACHSHHASPVVQLILETCSSKHKAWKLTVQKILSESSGGDLSEANPAVFGTLCRDRVASHVAEIIVNSCDQAMFGELVFEGCLRGRMLELAHDSIANFVLQHALAAIKSPEQCALAVDELADEVASNLLKGKLGVVWRLCQACQKGNKATQCRVARAVLQGVRATRNCRSAPTSGQVPTGTIELLLAVDGPSKESREVENSFERVRVSILGAKIVSALLGFAPENCRAVLESIASMSSVTLSMLSKDPIGGRFVLEPLMDAPLSAAWAKQRVLAKLKDDIPSIAENKFGWHVLRKGFDSGSLKERTLLVRSLAKKERRLLGTSYGGMLVKHCKVSVYRHDPDQWSSAQRHLGFKQKQKRVGDLVDELESTYAELSKSKRRAVSGDGVNKKRKHKEQR